MIIFLNLCFQSIQNLDGLLLSLELLMHIKVVKMEIIRMGYFKTTLQLLFGSNNTFSVRDDDKQILKSKR